MYNFVRIIILIVIQIAFLFPQNNLLSYNFKLLSSNNIFNDLVDSMNEQANLVFQKSIIKTNLLFDLVLLMAKRTNYQYGIAGNY
jgi:hypothetical protein